MTAELADDTRKQNEIHSVGEPREIKNDSMTSKFRLIFFLLGSKGGSHDCRQEGTSSLVTSHHECGKVKEDMLEGLRVRLSE